MSSLRLFSEEIDAPLEVREVLEEANGQTLKNIFLSGIWMQGDIYNRNKRNYPADVLAEDLIRYDRDFIKKHRALGELGHPDSPKVNLDRASHVITEMKRDGSNFIGKARILQEQPHGKMAAGFIKEGVQLAVSSRALGMTTPTDKGHVVNKVHICTAGDIVYDPSAPDAFVNGIMEGKEWVWENGVLKEHVLDSYKKEIKLASTVLRLFEQAMKF
jgi:hypothetical protein